MQALVIKPHRLSGPGTIRRHARELGIEMIEHVPSEDPAIPALDGFDIFMCFGAPWSVYGEEVRPWIDVLLERLREAVERDLPTLGVCFGAQAISKALGGEVHKAERWELGWGTVDVVANGPVTEGPWMMWHSDTFTLPEQAELLASTSSGPQAFRLGNGLYTQFHPEVDPDLFWNWCEIDDSDFTRFGVDKHDVYDEIVARADEASERSRRLLDWVVERAR